jgi:K+-sensing histidine kinase KdpD
MMQVMSTLLGNALKFTESSTVTITTQRNSDNIVAVAVQDISAPAYRPRHHAKAVHEICQQV